MKSEQLKMKYVVKGKMKREQKINQGMVYFVQLWVDMNSF
jgi:hypothetical protein